MATQSRKYLVLVALLALAGCGGGDNGGDTGGGATPPPGGSTPPPGGSTPPPSADVTPDAFTLKDVEDAEPGKFYTASMTVSGVDEPVKVRVCCAGPAPQFSIDGGNNWLDMGADVEVENGDDVMIRLKSSDKASGIVNASLFVGGTTGALDAEGTVKDNFQVVTKSEFVPPELAIHFPPPISMTDLPLPGTIQLRGTVGDNKPDVTVLVNDSAAVVDAATGTWTFDYAVQAGDNLLEVVAVDAVGNSVDTLVSITHVADRDGLDFGTGDGLGYVESALWDATRETLISGYMVHIDLETGNRTGSVSVLDGYGMLHDAANDRYIVADYDTTDIDNGVFIVDPVTGVGTALSTKGDGGPAFDFHLVNDLAVTEDGVGLFAHIWTNDSPGFEAKLWKIDSDASSATFGERAVFSGEDFQREAGLAADYARDRLLIGNCDLKTLPFAALAGTNSTVVIAAAADFCIQELSVHGDVAWARHVTPTEDKILEINLLDNSYSVLTDLKDSAKGPVSIRDRGMKFSMDMNKQLLFFPLNAAGGLPNAVSLIDMVSGQRVIVAQSN